MIAGSLKIIGDPSEFGNIELRLKENDSPVSIIPFSKNLSLVKQLDKEVRRVNLQYSVRRTTMVSVLRTFYTFHEGLETKYPALFSILLYIYNYKYEYTVATSM